MATYLGKCKVKGCKHALHVRDEAESIRSQLSVFTYVSDGPDASEPGAPYCVGNWGAYARCPEHRKLFPLQTVKGRLVPDHKCDSRCTNATGPNCDCSCGGANHGLAHA